MAQPTPPWCLFTVSSQVGGSSVFTKQRYYYSCDGITSPLTPGMASAALATWRTAIEPLYLALYAADSNLVQVSLAIHTGTELQEAFEPVTDSGTQAGESLPPQDCAVITWDYGVGPGARITRGRTFLSGIPEGQADGGTVLVAYTDNLDALALALQAPASIGGVSQALRIWTPKSGTFRDVTDHAISPIIKSLRRRRPGS